MKTEWACPECGHMNCLDVHTEDISYTECSVCNTTFEYESKYDLTVKVYYDGELIN